MSKNKNQNKALLKTGSTSIIKVGNSLKLTDKIIQEYDNRVLQSSLPTLKIGNQEWMTKNLDVDCYSNGDPIPQVQNPKDWENLKYGAWCYHGNDLQSSKKYNWFAVNDSRGLAPNEYEIPSIKCWTILFEETYKQLITENIKLKSKSEFTAFADDVFFHLSDILKFVGDYTDGQFSFWTSTEKNDTSAITVDFGYFGDGSGNNRRGNLFLPDRNKNDGYVVRCLKK